MIPLRWELALAMGFVCLIGLMLYVAMGEDE